jgi:hypothetical protein
MTKVMRAGTSSLVGSYSGSSYGHTVSSYEKCPGIPLCLLIALFAGLAAMFRTLCIAITKKGRRKKRSQEIGFEVEEEEGVVGGGIRLLDTFIDRTEQMIYSGMRRIVAATQPA